MTALSPDHLQLLALARAALADAQATVSGLAGDTTVGENAMGALIDRDVDVGPHLRGGVHRVEQPRDVLGPAAARHDYQQVAGQVILPPACGGR